MIPSSRWMPTIDIDLEHEELIDLRVVATLSGLTSLLRRVVDQTNAHEYAIEELKAALAAEKARGDALEAAVQGGHDRRRSMADVDREVLKLRSELDAMRDDSQRFREQTGAHVKERLAAVEQVSADHAQRIERDGREWRTVQAKHTEQLAFLDRRVDAIRVPSLAKLEERAAAAEAFQSDATPQLQAARNFIRCWGAAPARLAELCAGTSQLPEGEDEAPVAYLLGLPALERCRAAARQQDEFHRAAIEEKLRLLAETSGVGGGATRAELAALASELKGHQMSTRNSLDFLQRRVGDGEGVPGRIGAVEERLRLLAAQKADQAAVASLVDGERFQALRGHVDSMRADVDDVLERLLHVEVKGPAGAAGAAGAAAAAARPARDDLRMRVGELEVQSAALEARKADRDELKRFYSYLDNQAQQQILIAGSSGDPQSPLRRLGAGAGGAGGDSPSAATAGRHHGGGAARNSAPTSGPTSGHATPQRRPSGLLGDQSVLPLASRGHSPTASVLVPRRPQSAADTGMIEGHAPAPQPASVQAGGKTPVRVFLGRSVAVVRDSSGSPTPASITMSH